MLGGTGSLRWDRLPGSSRDVPPSGLSQVQNKKERPKPFCNSIYRNFNQQEAGPVPHGVVVRLNSRWEILACGGGRDFSKLLLGFFFFYLFFLFFILFLRTTLTGMYSGSIFWTNTVT